MDSVGIIGEYNPFHNGHLYHLKKVKKMYPNACTVLVMTPNWNQRGNPSVIDKWAKKNIALEAGIDLVVEMPYVFATESADIYSDAAVTILEKLKVKNFVFGSETNNIDLFKKIVDAQLNNEEFTPLVQIYLKMGENYPTALSKSLLDLTNENISAPNDLLGISYIKSIMKNNYKINPVCIKRKNNYHNEEIENIPSGTSIRKALEKNTDIKDYVPNYTYEKVKSTPLSFQENYFKFLKYKIMLEDNLDKYQTVDEGFGSKIKKEIINAVSWEDLINRVKTKRYTYNKINRMLTHILCDFTKEDKEKVKNLEYIRILGFSKKGREYINSIKKDIDIPLITNFQRKKPKALEIEFKSTCVYASIFNEEYKKELIEKEYKNNPMKGEN